jgi:hypothetical protein
VTLTATIRKTPEAGARHVDDMPVDWLIATATHYDEALTDVSGRVPEGWQIIALRTAA